MNGALAYLNGSWVPNEQLAIPIDDLGFTLGVTIVERMRTFGGQIFRLEEHLGRLEQSLKIVGWNASAILSEITAAINQWSQKNSGVIAAGDDWYVVCFVTPGKTPDAVHPTLCVHGGPLAFHTYAKHYTNGLQTHIVETRQVPPNCWSAEIKCRSRLHYYLADREARAINPSARGILLDQEGFVGEGSTANVVAYFADRGLVTPFRSKVLPGVSQQVLFEIADALGIPHMEADILPEELLGADEVYFTSTSVCLLPVTQINESMIGDGKPGPIFEQLIQAWSGLVGVEIVSQAQKFADRV